MIKEEYYIIHKLDSRWHWQCFDLTTKQGIGFMVHAEVLKRSKELFGDTASVIFGTKFDAQLVCNKLNE